ncbi:helix-turn-helix domain-containing protein [Mitsuaria sp. GD03876]|uniref:MarR family winged helix-turn-helix transcriptional regulator n=1 Tax=Mitsuaria sp. GD03876 TaxID=2975399 RepID=UPI00244A106C|nr:helix-turn-helix domain-containing protein [Mitsuaria sp. GD03876]MDH0865238.1 MarR family transcriptional regulator [Mitsuaria sp. GD03876]
MALQTATLGTLLRHLLELLDRDVEAAYAASSIHWRPRYTPVLRALRRTGPASIRQLSQEIGITHSAVSQTVSQMATDGWVELRPGQDARERIVEPTPALAEIVPALERQWAATNAAADQLDAELSAPLSRIAAEAIEALTRQPFHDRIAKAARRPAPRAARASSTSPRKGSTTP